MSMGLVALLGLAGAGCSKRAQADVATARAPDAWLLFSDAHHVDGSGDGDDMERIGPRIHGPTLWARRDGHEWLVRDAGLVLRAQNLMTRAHELARRQNEVGARQSKIGDQQTLLGKKISKLGEEMTALAGASDDDEKIDALDEQMDKLTDQMEELAEQNETLADEMEERGEALQEAYAEAGRHMMPLFDEARATGKLETVR